MPELHLASPAHRRPRLARVLVLAAAVVLGGCPNPDAGDQPTPSPGDPVSPTPTAKATPTATRAPTPSPSPSATPTLPTNGTPLDCDPATWSTLSANNPGYPQFAGNECILTVDEVQDSAGVILYNNPVAVPFAISFDYWIWDDDGNLSTWNAADGLVFFFLKDNANYANPPPSGGTRGFSADGTGYGVHLDTFDVREIILTDGVPNQLAAAPDDPYSHGVWWQVRIDVGATRVDVTFNGSQVISWSGALDTTHAGLGFSAATGGSDSEHKLRNIVLYR
jgi:hypothetical protein